jgi:methionine-rich copper-binding protein CopC
MVSTKTPLAGRVAALRANPWTEQRRLLRLVATNLTRTTVRGMRIRHLLLPVAFAVAALQPSPAFAHMGVDASNPENASTVEKAPEVATITFNADVEIETATAQIRYLGGPDTPITEATRRDVRTEDLAVVGTDGRTATFDMPELEPGLYAIDWAVNEAGGHSNTSFILFKVAERDGSPILLYAGVAIVIAVVGGLAVTLLRRSK